MTIPAQADLFATFDAAFAGRILWHARKRMRTFGVLLNY